MHEYVETYLANLPPELRPDKVTEAMLNSLRDAWRNKWEAKDLAKAVCAGNWGNLTNPIGYSMYRLKQVAQQKPFREMNKTKPVEQLTVERVPLEFKTARFALLRKIMVEKIPPDVAEQMMHDLITEQQNQNKF